MDPENCLPGKLKVGFLPKENPITELVNNDITREYYQVKQSGKYLEIIIKNP